MKNILLFLVVAFSCSSITAQTTKINARQKPAPAVDWVQLKNYYLLTLIERDATVSKVLENDEVLAKLNQQKLSDLTSSITDCKTAACFTDRVKFTDDEIKTVSAELAILCKTGSAIEQLVKTKLVPSGTYSLYKTAAPAELIVKAWEQDAAGINYTISVYADGKKPNYPLIDSISFNVTDKRYKTMLYDVNATLAGDVKGSKLFFEPSMHAALLYLQINERQDPANFEPMAQRINKGAVTSIKTINWAKYPYTVILIPGAGPDNLTSPLSAGGMLRCRLAAQQYFAGQAPFLMPSGGAVHPYKTKYCEAEEMKAYLVNVLHVPESAVITEPHARHTTTNMRNGARLMFRYGIPADKPGLVVTEKSQAGAIVNMGPRCMRELKYMPYKLGKVLSDTAVEFYPLPDALQINPYEPLDP